MKKLIIVLMILLFIFAGCERVKRGWKGKKREWIGERAKITLYAYDGSVIGSWTTNGHIERKVGGCIEFIDERTNKLMDICGIIVCEEL